MPLLSLHGIHAKPCTAPQIGHGVLCLCAFGHHVSSDPDAFACLGHLVNFQPFLDTEAAKTELLGIFYIAIFHQRLESKLSTSPASLAARGGRVKATAWH